MKRLSKKYFLTFFLIAIYFFSVKGALGMPLLSHLLEGDHGISVTTVHGDIHIKGYHTENHEPHTHHDNDFLDTHTGLIDTSHEHSEHESHLKDYSEDAIVKLESTTSFQLSYPVNTFNTLPVTTTYRYGEAYLKAPPPLYLSLAHISTTVLLI